MQSILESAIDAAIDAAPDVAPLILLGVPGGLSAAVEASKWDSSGLHRSVQALVQMETSDCASLVLHRIVGAESWRHAAANTMTRLHECRSDRYAPQLHKTLTGQQMVGLGLTLPICLHSTRQWPVRRS